MWSPLFLFFYHKPDALTRICYNQLCEIEGKENIIPVSNSCKSLPNTIYLKDYKDYFPQAEDYIMYDGLIYKYILHNKDFIKTKDVIVTVEYDTWWNYSSHKWLKWLIKEYDILGVEIINYQDQPDWYFFNTNIVDKLKIPKIELMCFKPLAVTCSKPAALIKIAEFVKDNFWYRYLINCELRFGMAAKITRARIGEIPFKRTIRFHEWDINLVSKRREGIFHPIKSLKQIKFD